MSTGRRWLGIYSSWLLWAQQGNFVVHTGVEFSWPAKSQYERSKRPRTFELRVSSSARNWPHVSCEHKSVIPFQRGNDVSLTYYQEMSRGIAYKAPPTFCAAISEKSSSSHIWAIEYLPTFGRSYCLRLQDKPLMDPENETLVKIYINRLRAVWSSFLRCGLDSAGSVCNHMATRCEHGDKPWASAKAAARRTCSVTYGFILCHCEVGKQK